jgi:phage/plasmid-like protein (TIGR03299 family)
MSTLTLNNDHTASSAHLSPIDLLGTRVEGTFTAEQAMELGKLGGWNVRKTPAFTKDPVTGLSIPMKGRNALVRTNPETGKPEFLGDVGDKYAIVQNEEHAEFLNQIVEESGANFEIAGSADGGKKVFLSMKLPGHINVGGVDQVQNSLLAINSHDGSMSFTLAVLPVRYACSNILNVMFGGLSNIIRIRHTSGAQTNMAVKARESLDIAFNFLDAFQAEADRMIQTTMTQAKFEAIIEREFGAPDDASSATITRSENKIAEMTRLFAEAQTQDGIRDTAWAGFNALTEWNDHYAPTRGDERELARASKAILEPEFKDQAYRLMMSA